MKLEVWMDVHDCKEHSAIADVDISILYLQETWKTWQLLKNKEDNCGMLIETDLQNSMIHDLWHFQSSTLLVLEPD
jgi:hypothetical protein